MALGWGLEAERQPRAPSFARQQHGRLEAPGTTHPGKREIRHPSLAREAARSGSQERSGRRRVGRGQGIAGSTPGGYAPRR